MIISLRLPCRAPKIMPHDSVSPYRAALSLNLSCYSDLSLLKLLVMCKGLHNAAANDRFSFSSNLPRFFKKLSNFCRKFCSTWHHISLMIFHEKMIAFLDILGRSSGCGSKAPRRHCFLCNWVVFEFGVEFGMLARCPRLGNMIREGNSTTLRFGS